MASVSKCDICGCSKVRVLLTQLLRRVSEVLVPSMRGIGSDSCCAACGGEVIVLLIARAALIGYHIVMGLRATDVS